MATKAQRDSTAWMVRLVEKSCPGAAWVKLHSVGETRAVIRVRAKSRCESDAQVREKEAFLAGIHPDVWQARLVAADSERETYEVTFIIPRQLSFA